MSRPPADNDRVGYKRPPIKHRFRKGQSGNPLGRPRTCKLKEESKPAGGAQVDDLVLKEAMRPIQLRENDQVIELPMIQAVLRSLGVAAVKGHHRSQLALAEMVWTVQEQNHESKFSYFKTMVEYKEQAEEVIAEARRNGQPPPDIVTHPEEIVIDVSRMEIRINGPQDELEKAQWDRLLERKNEHFTEEKDLRAKAKRSRKHREFYEEDAERSQKMALTIAAVIPDEKTRRAPGFDLCEWRERQQKMLDMMKDLRRKRDREARRAADSK